MVTACAPLLFSRRCPFEAALARALILRDKGERATIQGKLADITPPASAGTLSLKAWQGACLVYCATNQIDVTLVPKLKRQPGGAVDIQEAAFAVSQATGVLIERIRYEKSKISREIRAERTGYVCGRPPYGYRVVGGEFEIHPHQRHAVRYVFERIRARSTWGGLLASLKAGDFSKQEPTSSQPQFWDRVKIRRILKHARLYCLGEYSGGRMKSPVTIPSLSFLPADWLNTPTQSRPTALKESP